MRDTALVLSRHLDAVGVRTGPQAMLEELARFGSIPVFNMLTADHHPCQALADLLTLREAFGALDKLDTELGLGLEPDLLGDLRVLACLLYTSRCV